MGRFITIFSILGGFYHLIVVGGVFSILGIFISPLTHRSISLAFALIILFLLYPANKNDGDKNTIAWYDIGLLLIGVFTLGFVVLFQDKVTDYALYGILDTKGAIFAFALMVVS